MPCAASPPSTFCQEKVVASSLSQARSIAKAALVASQIVMPSRADAIQSALGTRTPLVVPFQVKTVSCFGSALLRSGSAPYAALNTRLSLILSCLTASVIQSSPKLSQAKQSTGRGPSIDHIASSIAPVSEAGTIAQR